MDAARCGDDLIDIAITGIAIRAPGSPDFDCLWQVLAGGADAISRYSPAELSAAGVDPALARDPAYVAAKGELPDFDCFDAAFFGYSPGEAERMDPQQRLILECSWHALEDAGCPPGDPRLRIGVFAGAAVNTYLLAQAAAQVRLDPYRDLLVNAGDFVAPRIAYELNLRGPAVTVQTACSTSLVAVHLAVQSLLAGDCDVALAGGVSVRFPQRSGYLHRAGGILSARGLCRPFDEDADGTVSGCGLGLVVLERLADARARRRSIRAVLKGSAVNNDGGDKAGFTAPGVNGQAAVIRDALAVARVAPEEIGYVECHGTGTPLGDAIELAALHRTLGGPKVACAIGSIKSNLGHLDAAAGILGLAKAVLALAHGRVPPTAHFRKANPELRLDGSRFMVPERLMEWPGGRPRRAGISSFGFGGTNAHVVLEESGLQRPHTPRSCAQLVALSARDPAALARMRVRLASALAQDPRLPFGAVAYTLQAGRQPLPHRLTAVCSDLRDAVVKLRDGPVMTSVAPSRPPAVALAFGAFHSLPPGGGAELYADEATFRRAIDEAAAILRVPPARLFEPDAQSSGAAAFAVQRALAGMWRALGVRTLALLAEGPGLLVAAAVNGLLPLDELLRRAAAGEVGSDLRGAAGGATDAAVVVRCGAAEPAQAAGSAREQMLRQLSALFLAGVAIDWEAHHPEADGVVHLPGYPFAKTRFLLDLRRGAEGAPAHAVEVQLPCWREDPARPARRRRGAHWVVIGEELAPALSRSLGARGEQVLLARSAAEARSAIDAAPPQTSIALVFAGDDVEALRSLVRIAGRASRRIELTVVTRAAVKAAPDDVVVPGRAMLWGLSRTAAVEYPNLSIRLLDVPEDGGAAVPERAADELLEGDATPVALRSGRRLRFAIERRALAARGPGLRAGAAYMIVGGFGGVGLALARHLASRAPHSKLALVGRTALPPRTEWAAVPGRGATAVIERRIDAVRELEAAGAVVLSLQADVTDPRSIREAVERAERELGPLAGVVHAAATPAKALLEAGPTPEVLAARVLGARALDEALGHRELDFFVLCSSVVALRGAAGQADSAAASAFLDSFASSVSPRRHAISIAWDRWSGTGMAAALPATAGHPLLGPTAGAPVLRHRATLTADAWIVDDHRWFGQPVVPGAALLEAACEAVRPFGDGGLNIDELWFARPLAVADGEAREIQTTVERTGDRRYRVRIAGRASAGEEWREHARAELACAPVAPTAHLDVAAARERTRPIEAADLARDERRARAAGVQLGSRWQSVKELRVGDGEWLATLELPTEHTGDLRQHRLHPALLDLAAGAGLRDLDRLYVAAGYRGVTVRGPLPARVVAQVRRLPAGSRLARYSATVAAPDGEVLVEIDEYVLSPARPPPPEAMPLTPADATAAFEAIVAARPAPWVIVSREDASAWLGGPRRPEDRRPERSGAEELVASIQAIFREVLGVAEVGADTDFFALGGDSVVAIDVVSRLNELGLHLSPVHLFDHPSPAALARAVQTWLEQEHAGGPAAGAPRYLPADFPAAELTQRELDELVARYDPESGAR